MNKSLTALAGLICTATGAGIAALALRRSHREVTNALADRVVAHEREADRLNRALGQAESDYRVAKSRIRSLQQQLGGIPNGLVAETEPLSDTARAQLRQSFRDVINLPTPEGGEQA